jgi:hypothetical protein
LDGIKNIDVKNMSIMDVLIYKPKNTTKIADDTDEPKNSTLISNSQISLEIRGSASEGIFIEVTSKAKDEEEVILKEEI